MSTVKFLEKIQSLKPSEIVELMIDAVENPVVKLRMSAFRGWDKDEKQCIGCAATNMLYKLTKIPKKEVDTQEEAAKSISVRSEVIYKFEWAIDSLRLGNIDHYNWYSKKIGMAKLREPIHRLPKMDDYNKDKTIQQYKAYVEYLKEFEL
jgi:hypothetical protein